ncbi:MAG TPA: ABC transporter permease, partial [Chloroflexota bacterium]|nr:ABC transporter permease [Chloroflexota bacterium]
ALSSTFGATLGLTCGYFGGWWDTVVMRVVDVWQAVPYLVLALAIAVVLGPGLETLILVLALGTWTTFARLVRSEALAVRARESVLAARVMGASEVRILARHVLPQVASTLVVTLSLVVASTILFEASLSFLGLGVQRPTPSWGNMLLDGVDVLGLAWWVSFFPGLAILLASLGINVLGDWLRDALDPLR